MAVGEAYAALAAQIGHSEISKFGENVIEKMFQKYRTNEDPLQGLSLWEFNNYLHSTGSFTLYDMKEYKIIMNMLGLLVDRYVLFINVLKKIVVMKITLTHKYAFF